MAAWCWTVHVYDGGCGQQRKDELNYNEIELNINQINDNLTLRVMDENVNANTEIGTCSIKLAAVCVNGGLESWWPIAFGSKQAGRLHVCAEWIPCGSDPVSVSAAAMPGQ